MTFEEVLQSIYVGKIEKTTNNHIYKNLNKEQEKIIKEMVIKNKFFEPTNVINFNSQSLEEDNNLENICIDFNFILFEDILSEVLRKLSLNYSLNFTSFKDALLFSEILKKYKKRINLHLFNIKQLNTKEQELFNSLLFEINICFALQIYVEDEEILKTNKTNLKQGLIQDLNYKIIEVEPSIDLIKKYKSE